MKKLIIANWKAYKNLKEAREWLAVFNRELLPENVDVVVCPAYPLLKAFEGVSFKLGAQDVSAHSEGSYTGEVTATQVSEVVDYVIVGHSERRRNFKETDEVAGYKIAQVLAADLTPLVCVSNLESVKYLTSLKMPTDNFILVYEPLDAISSEPGGHAYSVKDVEKFAREAKKFLKNAPLIYGGSVDLENVAEFARSKDIQGVLVGKASLKAKDFLNLIRVYAVC